MWKSNKILTKKKRPSNSRSLVTVDRKKQLISKKEHVKKLAEIIQERHPDEKVVLEYKFKHKRRWKMDIALPDKFICIEIHGGIFANGRHTRGMGFRRDREKMNSAQLLGHTVLEFDTGIMFDAKTIEDIDLAIEMSREIDFDC